MVFSLFQFYGYGRFGPFGQALAYLEQFGLLDSIIPFALIFAILYAMILKTNIFSKTDGKLNKKVTLVVALSITLVTVIPHVLGLYSSPYADPVVIINQSLPQIALILVAIVLVLIVTNALEAEGSDVANKVKEWSGWIALVLIGLVFYGALTPPGRLPGFLNFFADPFFYTILIILAVFGGVVYLVTSEKKDHD